MKIVPSAKRNVAFLVALVAPVVALLLPLSASAANGTWTNIVSGGNWSAATNWNGGTIADASGFTADFSTINITTDPTVVHLDSARTIGNLIFGDTTTSSAASWVLDNNANGANILTLAGGTPTITVNALGTSKNATISAALTGTAGLVKAGPGALILSGANTYTGPTIVNSNSLTFLGNQNGVTGGFYVGTNTAAVSLNIGSSSQTAQTTMNIAAGNIVKTASGASQYSTINVNGAASFPTFVTNNSSMSIGRDSGFGVAANGNWFQAADMTVQANGGFPGNFNVNAGGSFTYTGSQLITNSAPGSSGNATMTIAGTFNTGTGFYFNDSGTTGKPILVLADGGTIKLTGSISQLITDGGTGPLGTFLVGTNGTINTAGFSTTITNIIANNTSQTGSLVVSGGGTLTLSGYNTYTGGTIVTNNTTLVLAKGGATGAIRNNLTIHPGAVVSLTAADALGYGTVVTNVNIYGGLLTNTGAGLFESYSTYYNLSGGTVGSAGGPFSFSGQGITSLSNSVLSVFNAPVRFGASSTLTLSAAAGTVPGGVDLNILGGIYQGGTASGSSVIKTGAGVVKLNGANSYDGSTFINAGTLVLGATATLPNTTNISVAAGATLDLSPVSPFVLGSSQALGGSGTVNGSVSDNGGSQFNPGGLGTVGTLTITTNLTLAGGDTLNFDFSAGGSNDVINVGGTLTPNGTTTINLANWPVGGFLQTNYVLLQAASLGGSAGSFNLQNVPSGGRQTYSIIYDTSSSPQRVLLQVSGFNVNLVWQGGSGNAWDVQFTQDWLNNGTPDYFYTSDNVLFSNVPPANASVIISGGIQPGSVTFNSTNNYVLTSGYITGTANLVKNGSGSVTLATANDYTGGTTINGGTLQLGDGVANNGSVVGAIANNSALVISNASTQTLPNNINGSGQITAGGANSLLFAGSISGTQQVIGANTGGVTLSGTNSFTGGIAVNAGILVAANANALGQPASGVAATVNNGATFAYRVGGTQTLTNQITGAGAVVYSNASPGSLGNGIVGLKLSASNSFSGGLTINVGSVYAYNKNALGSGPVTIDNGNLGGGNYYNQLFVGNGLNISNAITIVNASDFFDGVLMVDPGPNNSGGASDTNGGTFSGPITIAVGATIQHGGVFCGPFGTNWLVITGPVTNLNSGGVVSSRNGRTRLSGGGSYAQFNISGGTTQIGANNGICPGAILQIAGGSFDLNGYSQTFTGLANPGAGSINNSSTNSISTLTLNLSSASTYSSVISGKLNLVLAGSSSLNLTGTNTYTGNTTVNGGTLEFAQATLATNSTVAVANGAFLQLDFTTTNQVGSLVTNGVSAGPGVYDSTTGAPFITGTGSLLVTATVATYPTNITTTVSGGTLTLTWPGTHLGWYAQSNSVSLANPSNWFDIPGSQTGTNLIINMNPAQTNVFYRLRAP